MFAVKGWNLDATTLKPQTEVDKHAGEGGEKKNKKRKRNPHANGKKARFATGANSEDVGRAWREHVESTQVAKHSDHAKGKRERKRRKVDAGSGAEKTVRAEKAVVRDGTNTVGRLQSAPAAGESANTDSGAKAPRKQTLKRQKRSGDAADRSAVGELSASESKGSTTTAKAASSGQLPKNTDSVFLSAPAVLPATAKLTPMQSAMRQKLVSARFRHLNQTLYTAPSTTALELFDHDPAMFEDYHAGFRQQVQIWPQNPVDAFIATIRERGTIRQLSQKKVFKHKGKSGSALNVTASAEPGSLAALPRTHGTCVIADLGCGDARLASTLTSSSETSELNLKLHSFDLSSPNKHVTKADISNLPLKDGEVDVAIFCLALMGTNWISFLEEAYRVLHWKGELWIAEIKSRFGRVGKGGKVVEHSVGSKRKAKMMAPALAKMRKEDEEKGEEEALRTEVDGVETKAEETDVSAFVKVLERRGFVLKEGETSVDLGNKMFVRLEFVKAAQPTKGKGVVEAQAGGGGDRDSRTWKPKAKKAKFLDEGLGEDVGTEDEAGVLKPCLYKIR